jgi:uncharacterized protein YggE
MSYRQATTPAPTSLAPAAVKPASTAGTAARPAGAATTLFCLALAGAALVTGTPFATATAAEREEPRLVSVQGAGEVRAQPDRATVTLGITTRQPTVEAARQEANRVTEQLLGVARGLQIPNEQIRSTRINVNPEYVWNEPRRQRDFKGYVVQRQLIVDLRDIEKLGPLMEKSMTAGANLVQEPVLDSSKRKDLERQALALAVEDARRNADVLARSVGMAVGMPRNVAGNGAFQPPQPMPMVAMARAAPMDAVESPQTYQTGELVFSASASVTYDLVPAAK